MSSQGKLERIGTEEVPAVGGHEVMPRALRDIKEDTIENGSRRFLRAAGKGLAKPILKSFRYYNGTLLNTGFLGKHLRIDGVENFFNLPCSDVAIDQALYAPQ